MRRRRRITDARRRLRRAGSNRRLRAVSGASTERFDSDRRGQRRIDAESTANRCPESKRRTWTVGLERPLRGHRCARETSARRDARGLRCAIASDRAQLGVTLKSADRATARCALGETLSGRGRDAGVRLDCTDDVAARGVRGRRRVGAARIRVRQQQQEPGRAAGRQLARRRRPRRPRPRPRSRSAPCIAPRAPR